MPQQRRRVRALGHTRTQLALHLTAPALTPLADKLDLAREVVERGLASHVSALGDLVIGSRDETLNQEQLEGGVVDPVVDLSPAPLPPPLRFAGHPPPRPSRSSGP